MAIVEMTPNLTKFFPQFSEGLSSSATTVAEVVQDLEQRAPGFAFYVCDEAGRLRRHVNIFVADEMIVDRRRLSDPVPNGARVFIAQALSGG